MDGTKIPPTIWFTKDLPLMKPQMSDNLAYWRNNSYPIAFQNHHAGIIFSGERIHLNGYGTGGINGQGNAWYNAEKANTQPGRPMPFVWWNVSDVMVEHCEYCRHTQYELGANEFSLRQGSSTVDLEHHEWNQHVVRRHLQQRHSGERTIWHKLGAKY